ncbi:MAG TPA: tRNA (adenosine(37)-N6)-threonylcarbamoyltransferase complex transferase subunit TsaD [Candidatus Paceibacterota bacterium]|nr:tRNA (adenosine(37)-N6)-threonylcarbamoyltransferase complex transferase subunit TsaD [Candidatus Paceibacterota bacterium]
MLILGIETSCDDTALALVEATGDLKEPHFKKIASVISSQIKVHKKFGGVVPILAAREHEKNIFPVITRLAKQAGMTLEELSSKVDLIAVTYGPGLKPALLIGVTFARALSCLWNKPLLGVNHLEGHLFANFIDFDFQAAPKLFPAICLLVSGGHTQIIYLKSFTQYKLLGETLDDAAGEAFDKVARLLNLGYPGGPFISKAATYGDPTKYAFPRPMLDKPNYDFSFSGLKTAVLYTVQKLKIKPRPYDTNKKPNKIVADLAASFENAVVDTLVTKTVRAAKENKVKSVWIGGGVSANSKLRETLGAKLKEELPNIQYFTPPMALTTDNGLMIAAAAYLRQLKGAKSRWQDLDVCANLTIK